MCIRDSLSNWSKDYKQLISDYPERVKIAKQFNPLFIPRNYILESVANHYTDEQRNELNDPDAKLDNGPLQKLILMATNPYDKSAWDSSFLPELEKKWTNVTEDEDLLMTQCSCSS